MLPQLVKIGNFFIPTYGVLVTSAFLIALWMATRLAARAGLDKEAVLNLGIYCGLAGIVGAKLLMGVSPFEAKRMQGPFELSDYYVDMLTQLGHGQGLLQLSNAMLKVSVRIPQDLGIY